MKKIIITYSNCICILLIIICTTNLQAQTNVPNLDRSYFMISSVGKLDNVSNNSPAIQFTSTSTCIDVQSGLAIFNGVRGSGQFSINCEVAIKFNNLGAGLYPNPAVNSTKLKIKNTPSLTKVYKLDIWTTEGILVNTMKRTGYSLTQGINIDISGLQQGAFILRVESTESVDAIKFIKTE